MPAYYPLHLDLTGKLCLVVGGGSVAERKVNGLLDAQARVRVVCLAATGALQRMGDARTIELILNAYESAHLSGVCLAFAATDRAEINERVAADAAARNVWVNRADLYEAGDFIVPAVVRRGDVCLSLSTGGHQPLLTARLAEEFALRFGPDYGDYVALLGRLRADIKARTTSPQTRRAAMQTLLDAEHSLRQCLAKGEMEEALELAENLLTPVLQADANEIVPSRDRETGDVRDAD